MKLTSVTGSKFVPKAWGHEEILESNPLYTLKRLTILPGFQCSLHFHKLKTETFIIEEGSLYLELLDVANAWKNDGTLPVEGWDQWIILHRGQRVTLPPLMAHRFRANSDVPCRFLEVSTQDLPEDSYRLSSSGPVPE